MEIKEEQVLRRPPHQPEIGEYCGSLSDELGESLNDGQLPQVELEHLRTKLLRLFYVHDNAQLQRWSEKIQNGQFAYWHADWLDEYDECVTGLYLPYDLCNEFGRLGDTAVIARQAAMQLVTPAVEEYDVPSAVEAVAHPTASKEPNSLSCQAADLQALVERGISSREGFMRVTGHIERFAGPPFLIDAAQQCRATLRQRLLDNSAHALWSQPGLLALIYDRGSFHTGVPNTRPGADGHSFILRKQLKVTAR